MSTVYLHIGLPKTGTSTVQNAIQKLRPVLAQRGYWTPEGIMAHHRFAVGAMAADDPRLKQAHYQRVLASGNDGVFAAFEQAASDGKSILLSSEYLNDCGGKAAADLLARFGVTTAQARVIVCLRRQDRFIASHYNQEVKRMGRTQKLAWSHEEAPHWDWYRRLVGWANEFGNEALHVLVFERLVKQAPGALFAKAVLAACDLPLDDSEFERIAGAVQDYANASLPAELVEFARAANTVTRIGEAEWLFHKAMAAGMRGTPFRMDRALAAEIVEYYKPSNAEVVRRFLREPGPLFDDEIDAPPDTTAVPNFDPKIMSQLIALLAAEIGTLRTMLRQTLRRSRAQQGRAGEKREQELG